MTDFDTMLVICEKLDEVQTLIFDWQEITDDEELGKMLSDLSDEIAGSMSLINNRLEELAEEE